MPELHPVLHTPVDYLPQPGEAVIYLAAGCFWGVERIFWQTPGVVATTVGYTGGHTSNPSYVQVCTGTTGHAETVRVVYDRSQITDGKILSIFWENHDPTQGNRQGNDVGTQYRSAVWTTDREQDEAAHQIREAYQQRLTAAGFGAITTTIEPFGPEQVFWPAEDYHQAYLWKNPNGYCNHGFNGVGCPVGLGA
ncbi:peptide-methionine (S)-S-oxide reductase MsrA [Scrofimicrobium sp. R131]|uniref:Peptide methionine sulfoxide reductase MsrA n=1 Tax=Scrofimicrobium appendicitidis TaxID=3079930 RepID=A0AAU7V7F6_9ACTO